MKNQKWVNEISVAMLTLEKHRLKCVNFEGDPLTSCYRGTQIL